MKSADSFSTTTTTTKTNQGTSTTPVPTEELLSRYSQNTHLFMSCIARPPSRTDFFDADEIHAEAANILLKDRIRRLNVVVCAAVMIGSARAVAADELSRPAIDYETVLAARIVGERPKRYAVANFIKPVKFQWTKLAHRVRRAAKRFSEQTNANY